MTADHGMLAALQRRLADLDPQRDAAAWMQALVADALDRLPQPGSGQTLQRWQALSAVAAHDLSLAKLYEGHTDALAILRELRQPLPQAMSVWGMWAAEAPGARVLIERHTAAASACGPVRLRGAKPWCSGAATVSHGLLTAWHVDGRGPQLVAVSMRQPGVSVRGGSWQAVGMSGSASPDVAFDDAHAELVGQPGDYLSRPGFWQGGAGIAACWHGGATFIASVLHSAVAKAHASANPSTLPFRQAALGRIDTDLAASAALLRESAQWIDAHPRHDASALALRVRLRAECAARLVLDGAGAALGATPFCRDARFARMAADLPVFIRQSHGERDFAALGERVAAAAAARAGWAL